MFNLGPGEIILLLLLGVLFLGPATIPELMNKMVRRWLDPSSLEPLPPARASRSWTAGEWLLVVATVILASTAVALFVFRR